MWLRRCASGEACTACTEGWPCPLDIVHHPIVEYICKSEDGKVPKLRRTQIASSPDRSLVPDWCRNGHHDLSAGYAAWLVADSWAQDGNESRAGAVVDLAQSFGAQDSRLHLMSARQLAAQGRHDEVKLFVGAVLAVRNTDSGWDDLADWYARYAGWKSRRAVPPPKNPDVGPRLLRPAGRHRPRRFAP